MTDYHFTEDYAALVTDLQRQHDRDSAMHRAVGGGYTVIGTIESNLLNHFGLAEGMHVLDLGCGSGRLSTTLSIQCGNHIKYTGVDIVQDLLDYARSKAHPDYKFILNRDLTIPALPRSIDIVCAFSVFTHLHQAEIYVYLCEMARVLKPSGKAIVSYQSMDTHWDIFQATVNAHKLHHKPWPHMNMFMTLDQISTMAYHAGLYLYSSLDAYAAPWGDPKTDALGQHTVVLKLR